MEFNFNFEQNFSFIDENYQFTSTPIGTNKSRTTIFSQFNYKPKVNFHSIESLASPISSNSSISNGSKQISVSDDSAYHSSDNSVSHRIEKENRTPIRPLRNNLKKPRQKFTDCQNWYLTQFYSKNRYPSYDELERIASDLMVPMASIRIWFQNHRARNGKN